MNTDNGGALEFDAYLNNEKLNSAIRESEKLIKGFGDTAENAGEKIDEVFEVTAENIKIQKDVISQLEGEIKALNAEIEKVAPGKAQNDLKKQAAELTAELNREKEALKQLENEFTKTNETVKSSRQRMREISEELINMKIAGLEGSEAYNKLEKEAAELGDTIRDVKGRISDIGNDERMFQGIISGVSGVAGAFSAAQGAVGLFAGENENLQKIMLKVQSLMAITIGLQEVAKMLNKDEAFMSVVVAKGKEMLAVANMKLATALGVSTAAAQVLMATLTLGLSVAITAIIVAISKFQSKAAEARKQQEAFNKATAEAAYKPLSAIQQLSSEWKSLGDNLQAKEKYVKDNADKFKELGIAINDVNDAEKILTSEATKKKIIDAMMFRAQAAAAVELADEKYKEWLLKKAEVKEVEGKLGTSTSRMRNRQREREYNNLNQEAAELKAQADAYITQSTNFKNQSTAIVDGINASVVGLTTESIATIKENISKLNQEYENVPKANNKRRAEILAQIQQQEAILKQLDKRNKEKADNSKALKAYDDSIKEQLDAEEQVLKRLEIINEARKKLIGDKSELGKGKNEILTNYEKDIAKQQRDIVNKLLEDYAGYLDRKKKLQEDFNNDMLLLQTEYEKATPEKQQQISVAMLNRQAKFNKDNKTSGDADYDALIEQYKNYEQRKNDIEEQYAEQRAKAALFKNTELIGKLLDSEKKAIKELKDEFIETAGLQNLFIGDGSQFLEEKIRLALPMFTDLASATKEELEKVKQVISEIEVTPDQKKLLLQIGLTQEEVDLLIKKLEELKKKGEEAVDKQEWQNVLDTALKLSDSIANLGASLAEIGGTVGEIGAGLSELAGGFDDIYTAMTSQNPADVISAGINGLTKIITMITNQIRENKEVHAQWNEKIAESAHLLRIAKLEALAYQQSNIFGVENPYAKATAGMKEYAAAISELQKSSKALEGGQVQTGTKQVISGKNTGIGAAGGAAVGAAVGSIIPGIGTLIGAGVGAAVGAIAGAATTKTVPVFESLKKKYGEIYDKKTFELNPKILADYNKLDENTKKLVDNWEEIKTKAKEAQEQINETLTSLAGDLGQSLSQSLLEAFSNGDLYAAIDDFEAKVTDTIENIISQLIFDQVFGDMFDKLSADMQRSFEIGGDQNIVDDLAKFNTDYQKNLELYNEAMKAQQEFLKDQGFDIFKNVDGAASKNSLSGAIKGVTEDTANILAGQMNAIRINQLNAIQVMKYSLLALNKIASNTSFNVNLKKLDGILKAVESMAKNDTKSLGL